MATFRAVNPQTAEAFGPEISSATQADVHAIIESAAVYNSSPSQRAALLGNIAAAIEADRAGIVEIAMQETGLPEARLNGELTRTVFQLNTFAECVATGRHLNATIDHADPNYPMGPRPDIRKQNQALGVVAVFAASNFPLAFSLAGGDSASALAAGNAVVVKGHPSHPNTTQRVFDAVQVGIATSGAPKNLFTLIQGNDPQITHWIAEHPRITAIGFTGSGLVGRILLEIAAKREVPIPVYAEMGAINPVFVTSAAIAERSESLAKGSVDSALLGSGQFCTKPGLFVLPSSHAEIFIAEVEKYLATLSVGPLLNEGIANRYNSAIAELAKLGSVRVLAGENSGKGFAVTPTFFITDWSTAHKEASLLEEHFGPTTVMVVADESDFGAIARSLEGQLTATIHGANSDNLHELIDVLADRAGRVIWNAFPTGVSVTAAQQHGGQWPSSSSHTTSVGIDAIYRFMRPVAYQGFAQSQLPEALQDSNPWDIPQNISLAK
ncbi:MAG: hypothetical protein RL414_1151 [Actinomycetota bacterium]